MVEKVVLAIMFLTGLRFIVLGVMGPPLQLAFLRRAARTTGTVTEVKEERTEPEDDPRWDLTIAFTALDGSRVSFHAMRRDTDFWVGQEIPVLYDPADPQSAEVEYSRRDVLMTAAAFLAIGAVWTLIVVLSWFHL